MERIETIMAQCLLNPRMQITYDESNHNVDFCIPGLHDASEKEDINEKKCIRLERKKTGIYEVFVM